MHVLSGLANRRLRWSLLFNDNHATIFSPVLFQCLFKTTLACWLQKKRDTQIWRMFRTLRSFSIFLQRLKCWFWWPGATSKQKRHPMRKFCVEGWGLHPAPKDMDSAFQSESQAYHPGTHGCHTRCMINA